MRYIDLTRPSPAQNSGKKHERYREYNIAYENTPERKEYMKEYNKAYRTEHKVYVRCDCGSEIKSISMYAHVKTKKHLDYIQDVSVPMPKT